MRDIIILIVGFLMVPVSTYFICRAIDRLCERIDRLADAWEKDDDDDGDSWKKEKL